MVAAFALAGPGAAQAPIPNPMMPANPMMVPGAARTGPAVERDPEFGDLPIGPGMEDVYYTCTGCHSSQTFQQQRLTDARWDYLWDWMIEHQGMAEQEPEVKEAVLAYLKTHFSAER
jgi:hypothetical protein